MIPSPRERTTAGRDIGIWVFLARGRLAANRPFMRVGNAWISLDSFVRIKTFQWVTRDFPRVKFLTAFCGQDPAELAAVVETMRECRIAHEASLPLFLIICKRLYASMVALVAAVYAAFQRKASNSPRRTKSFQVVNLAPATPHLFVGCDTWMTGSPPDHSPGAVMTAVTLGRFRAKLDTLSSGAQTRIAGVIERFAAHGRGATFAEDLDLQLRSRRGEISADIGEGDALVQSEAPAS